MARKLNEPENYRVVIYPARQMWLTATKKSDELITCEHIEKDVKKHVDDVGSVSIEFDREPVCEHCGAIWTETSPDFNGGCCDKDMEAEPQEATLHPAIGKDA